MRSHGSRASRLPGAAAQPISSRHTRTGADSRRIVRMKSGSPYREARIVAAGWKLLAAALAVARAPQSCYGKAIAHFVHARRDALALDFRKIGTRERLRVLLHGQLQLAAGDLILTHVIVGITDVAGRRR